MPTQPDDSQVLELGVWLEEGDGKSPMRQLTAVYLFEPAGCGLSLTDKYPGARTFSPTLALEVLAPAVGRVMWQSPAARISFIVRSNSFVRISRQAGEGIGSRCPDPCRHEHPLCGRPPTKSKNGG